MCEWLEIFWGSAYSQGLLHDDSLMMMMDPKMVIQNIC